MTATPSPKSFANRIKPGSQLPFIVALALIVAALVLLSFFLWRRDSAERLRIVLVTNYTVFGDNLYASSDTTIGGHGAGIRAQSIHGGDMRVIGAEESGYQLAH